jgi:hypothetical protein
MPLNDKYDFAKQTPAGHQAAFTKRFGVHRALLKPGTELYKRTEYNLVHRGEITPWWNFLHATTVTLSDGRPFSVSGFDVAQARARLLGVSDKAFAQARSAVTQQWNQLTNVLRTRLLVEAYGWFGQNSGMPLDETAPNPRQVMLIGGAYQIYIPNLLAGMMVEF